MQCLQARREGLAWAVESAGWVLASGRDLADSVEAVALGHVETVAVVADTVQKAVSDDIVTNYRSRAASAVEAPEEADDDRP